MYTRKLPGIEISDKPNLRRPRKTPKKNPTAKRNKTRQTLVQSLVMTSKQGTGSIKHRLNSELYKAQEQHRVNYHNKV